MAIVLLGGACGASSAPPQSDWALPNLSRSSTRAQDDGAITPASVARLRRLWSFRVPDSLRVGVVFQEQRVLIATPIVAGDSVYLQDTKSGVYALDRTTGKLRWQHPFKATNAGRNGVAFSSGSVYGATDTTAFALSSRTGRLLWQRRLVTDVEQFVDIAPLVADNVVYTSTVGYPPGGRGALYALDAHSGKVLWKLSTIREPWHSSEAGGGGAWYTASYAGGTVYSGVANPYPLGGRPGHPNGADYPGPVLYTDSLLAIDGRTGKLRWYDQVTPHDVRDHDFQLPPILTGRAVIGAGKGGIVIAWDPATHRRIWQTRVGKHLNDAGPLPARKVSVCPGLLGGVQSPMAYADGKVFVPVVDLCSRASATGYQPLEAVDPTRGTGELVALDAADGRVLWKRALPQPDFGCATETNGVVFTSTFDGHLYGLDAATGKTLWQARAPAGINGCPAVAGGMLVVPAGSETRKMHRPAFALVAYALPG